MVYRIEFHNKHYYKAFENRAELEKYFRNRAVFILKGEKQMRKYLKKYNTKELKNVSDIRKVKKNGVSETVLDIFFKML